MIVERIKFMLNCGQPQIENKKENKLKYNC